MADVLKLMFSEAMDNMDGILETLTAPAQAQPPLPSVSEIAGIMSGVSPGTLAGGRRGKSGGSKSRMKSRSNSHGKSKSKTKKSLRGGSSRSKRADMRERYRMSPKKRVRRGRKAKK